TPLTLVILFCGLGLGSIITIADVQTANYFWLAVTGLVAYTSAFVCEVLRSGVNTVPLGQAEAARSIGLSFTQTLRIVVLPQAFRAVIAPLGSVLIALIKNTTIAAAIGVPEAFYTMRNELQSHGDIVIPIFAGYALFFVVLTLPVGLLFGWLAKRWAVARGTGRRSCTPRPARGPGGATACLRCCSRPPSPPPRAGSGGRSGRRASGRRRSGCPSCGATSGRSR